MSPRWKILEPIQLGNVTCQNRIMMAAHSYGYTDDNGLPTMYLLDYLVERAKGGVGVVVMGGTSVSPEGDYRERITYNVDQNIVHWYKEIAETINQYDTLILDQLMHPGGQLEALEGVNIVAPSPIHHEYTRGMPTELTQNGIRHIRMAFVDAAKRVHEGGLNGIELKCDQGFLIHQFLSPYYNRRTDIYGGNHANRFRFLKELIGEIRDVVGKDFIVGVRLTGDAMAKGDISLQDTLQIAQDLDHLRAVDYIHVNGGTNSSFIGYLVNHGDSSIGPMNFAPLAREIKTVVNIPVILASMILRPEEAEYVVNAGIADMVAMTRAHIADPEIVNKVKNGRVDEIRPCVLTNQGCIGNHWKGKGCSMHS